MSPLFIDLFVFVVLLISAGIAFLRGFIKEVLTIVGMAGATFAAYAWGDNLNPIFQDWMVSPDDKDAKLWGMIPMDMVASVLAYGAIFLLVFIGLSVLSYFLSKSVREMGLGAVDRSFGVLFGLLRGIVLVSLLYWPLLFLVEEDEMPDWITEAKTIPVIEYCIDKTYDIFDLEMSKEATTDTPEKLDKRLKAVEQFLPKQGEGATDKPDTGEKRPNEAGYKKSDRQKLDDLIKQND